MVVRVAVRKQDDEEGTEREFGLVIRGGIGIEVVAQFGDFLLRLTG
jgi:hypothetical protein